MEKNNGTSDQRRRSECTQVWENHFSLGDIAGDGIFAFNLFFFAVIQYVTYLLCRVKDFLQIEGT